MADEETPDAVDGNEPDEPTEPTGDDVEAMRAALAKANDQAKKYRLKARELEPLAAKAKELEDADKSELQRANDRAAEAERRAEEAQRGVAEKLAASEIKAALARVIEDPDLLNDLVDDLNISRYLDDDGELDPRRVKKLVARHEAMAGSGGPPAGARVSSGARGGGSQSSDMNALLRRGAGRG